MMGDTANGSWGSRELGAYMQREERRKTWDEYEAEIEETNKCHKHAVAAMVKRDYPLTRSQLIARNLLIFIGGVVIAVVGSWVIISLWFQIPLR